MPPRRIELPVFGRPLWYLGLDIGSCGIRAVLCEQRSRKVYPLQWRDDRNHLVSELPFGFCWSLQPSAPASLRPILPFPSDLSMDFPADQDLEVDRFKAALLQPSWDLGFPRLNVQGQPWARGTGDRTDSKRDLPSQRRQPRISLEVSISSLRMGLAEIFRRLSPGFLTQVPGLCQSPLLTTEELPQVLAQLAGVIVNCPSDASAHYRSFLREAIQEAHLVDQPSRIVFLEEAVAGLLGHLPLPVGQIVVVHSSYSRTELALLSIPQGPISIQGVLGFNGGQVALAQAIVGQLLYPLIPSDPDRSPLDTFNLPEIPTLSLEEMRHPQTLWQKQILQGKLEYSPLGALLLQAAERLQTTLQNQDQFTLRIGQQTHILQATAWQTQIVQPFHQNLQETFQVLLRRSQLPPTAIDYIIGTGSLGSQPWVVQGLQPLCPTAKVIETPIGSVDQVALGLAQFPLYGAATVP